MKKGMKLVICSYMDEPREVIISEVRKRKQSSGINAYMQNLEKMVTVEDEPVCRVGIEMQT